MSSDEIREGREAVEVWLRETFPDAHLEVMDDARSQTVLFRTQVEAKRWHELEIPHEALGDYRASIVHDLEKQGVGDLLRENPHMRFPYLHLERRVLPIERKVISCEGRSYVITRQPGGLVSILNADGTRMSGMPTQTIMMNSIHCRHPADWCRDVEKWSGNDEQ